VLAALGGLATAVLPTMPEPWRTLNSLHTVILVTAAVVVLLTIIIFLITITILNRTLEANFTQSTKSE